MNVPESIKAELAAWNNGQGIDLESWIGCVGNFSLAVGYLSIFCPEFTEFEGYILRKRFSEDSLRGFEKNCNGDKKAVEAVMNHLHIADIQHYGCADISKDKVIVLGSKLKEIYEARLIWRFPNKPCTVSFYQPEDDTDLEAYEITFWQKANEE
ncbi:MAG TPA: hypothetical protein VF599_02560 [Pyrinomonadaceae bacterium]|jgi:hypothetical protein